MNNPHKLLKISFATLALLLGLVALPAQAQVSVNVQVGAPVWGPPVPAGVQYYYIPEIDGYYDLYHQVYVYFDPYYNTWVSTPALPPAYAGYDPRFFHPVVVQYIGAQPWGLIYDHRAYSTARGWRPGYYRATPGPRWQRSYAAGYPNQPGHVYNNYNQGGPNRGGNYGGGQHNAPGNGPDRPSYHQAPAGPGGNPWQGNNSSSGRSGGPGRSNGGGRSHGGR